MPTRTLDLKNFEGKLERESPKRVISVSGGFGLLQMVSVWGGVPTRTLDLKGGGL